MTIVIASPNELQICKRCFDPCKAQSAVRGGSRRSLYPGRFRRLPGSSYRDVKARSARDSRSNWHFNLARQLGICEPAPQTHIGRAEIPRGRFIRPHSALGLRTGLSPPLRPSSHGRLSRRRPQPRPLPSPSLQRTFRTTFQASR